MIESNAFSYSPRQSNLNTEVSRVLSSCVEQIMLSSQQILLNNSRMRTQLGN